MLETVRGGLAAYAQLEAPAAELLFIDPSQVVFEECVRMNCFYCGKYGRNWRCPPNLPDLDYQKMFSEFDDGVLVACSYDIVGSGGLEEVRTESSIALLKVLLKLEKWLYNHNRPTAISFGAGSCKLCRGGCGKERCNNPYMARCSLEATGCNVVKTAAKAGLEIRFPPIEKLMRVGLVLWQDR